MTHKTPKSLTQMLTGRDSDGRRGDYGQSKGALTTDPSDDTRAPCSNGTWCKHASLKFYDEWHDSPYYALQAKDAVKYLLDAEDKGVVALCNERAQPLLRDRRGAVNHNVNLDSSSSSAFESWGSSGYAYTGQLVYISAKYNPKGEVINEDLRQSTDDEPLKGEEWRDKWLRRGEPEKHAVLPFDFKCLHGHGRDEDGSFKDGYCEFLPAKPAAFKETGGGYQEMARLRDQLEVVLGQSMDAGINTILGFAPPPAPPTAAEKLAAAEKDAEAMKKRDEGEWLDPESAPAKGVPTAVSSEAAMRKTDALVDVRWDLDAKNDEPLDYDANIWTLPSADNQFQMVYSAAQSTWAIEENQNCDQVRRQMKREERKEKRDERRGRRGREKNDVGTYTYTYTYSYSIHHRVCTDVYRICWCVCYV